MMWVHEWDFLSSAHHREHKEPGIDIYLMITDTLSGTTLARERGQRRELLAIR